MYNVYNKKYWLVDPDHYWLSAEKYKNKPHFHKFNVNNLFIFIWY